jgi:hypothetical protein
VTVIEDEPSAKKIRRTSFQDKVLSQEGKSVESSSKLHREETGVSIKINQEKGFLKLSSLLPGALIHTTILLLLFTKMKNIAESKRLMNLIESLLPNSSLVRQTVMSL